MLALARARWRYLPRTPPLSFERSYSERRSSEERLRAFCVAMFFSFRGPTGTDDENLGSDICVGHHQCATASGHAECEEALLENGVIWVGVGQGQ